MRWRHTGFTLLEMTLVVALMASLIVAETERQVLANKEKRRQLFVQQVEQLQRAVLTYRSDRSQMSPVPVPLWPTNAQQLLLAPHNQKNYLGGLDDASSVFGHEFKFSATHDSAALTITTALNTTEEAEMIAPRLLAFGANSTGKKVEFVVHPESSPTNEYYLRSGALPLSGDMNANQHSLNNLFELHTQDLIVSGTQAILSDRRAKENIAPLTGNGTALRSIQPLSYRKGGKDEIGFAADQVGPLYPQLVHPRLSLQGKRQLYLSYDGLLAVLWGEVQHLAQRLEELEEEKADVPVGLD